MALITRYATNLTKFDPIKGIETLTSSKLSFDNNLNKFDLINGIET